MKVRVDRERCEGHGQCSLVSDELFPVDDEGYSAIESGGKEVPAGDEDVAEEGVYNCPARALVLEKLFQPGQGAIGDHSVRWLA